MKFLALYSMIVSLAVTAAVGQNQSDIDLLRARADVQELKISQLEQELKLLKAQLAQVPVAAEAVKLDPDTESASSKSSNSNANDVRTYVVKGGDVLSRIAKEHNVTVAQILELNALDNDRIYVGQKLLIGKSATATVARSEAVVSPTPVGEHKVESGETFFSIARDHDVSVASLQAANPAVVPTKLSVGQILKIDGNAKAAPLRNKSVNKAPQKSAVDLASSSANKSAPKTNSQAKSSATKAPQRDPEPAIRTITVDQQITYGQFASKHGASTTQLNELNGLSLSKNTTLAKGSELYVPKF